MSAPMPARRFDLFVYGTELPGEPDAALLAGAEALGPARTLPGYALVELTGMAGLVAEGDGVVAGALYRLSYETLRACDIKREVGRLFQRRRIALAGGLEAEAYLLERDQVRGKRRVKGGDWRARFAPKRPDELSSPGPFVRYLRNRDGRG